MGYYSRLATNQGVASIRINTVHVHVHISDVAGRRGSCMYL